MARPSKAHADIQLVGDKPAAREIARLRAAFNEGIDAQDFDAIAAVLGEEAILVPGDDAQPIIGRKAQLEAWQSIFSQCQEVGYVRSPARIEIAEEGHLAAESGRWKGGWLSDGMTIGYTGRYFAKWRFDEDGWKIAAEVFVTVKRGTSRL
ncbi:MAG: nuclear transport factor 2 family protein [Alphaproteobacteria bacterium]|nr:nuclear transport factor 2 family protein [Alphaproteobacteria bacterium]